MEEKEIKAKIVEPFVQLNEITYTDMLREFGLNLETLNHVFLQKKVEYYFYKYHQILVELEVSQKTNRDFSTSSLNVEKINDFSYNYRKEFKAFNSVVYQILWTDENNWPETLVIVHQEQIILFPLEIMNYE